MLSKLHLSVFEIILGFCFLNVEVLSFKKLRFVNSCSLKVCLVKSLLNLKFSLFNLHLLLLLNCFHISEKLLYLEIILFFLFDPDLLLIGCSLLNHLSKVAIVVSSLGFGNRFDESTAVPNLIIRATTHHDGCACTSQWHR